MKKGTLQQAFRVIALTSAALLALSAPFNLQARASAGTRDAHQRRNDDQKGRHHDRDDDDDSDVSGGLARIATGQFITPTALEDSVQQPLNPGLPSYPN